ncbi:NAD(P)-binding domain-containing protein [Rhizobium sp. SG2393]|uniref:NAD(P)-binding domain-containing protein n=1 Tax=Rhizobium sp. SG2393 TaxID=3276279 RepID=UPI00366FC584
MKIGFLGVGHLAASVITGLQRSGIDPSTVLLAPRGKGQALAAAHGFALARDNADLVARADLVFLAVRPADAASAVAGLPWRAGQVLISACAGVPIAGLAAGPASIVRAMPLTASEIGASPTVFFPDDPMARALLSRIGPAIALTGEAEFEIATVNAAVYGWAQDLIRQSAVWAAAAGGDAETMRRLAALTFVAAGRMMAEKDDPMERLLADLVTPGGITELGLDRLDAAGQPAAWRAACDAVLARLRKGDGGG